MQKNNKNLIKQHAKNDESAETLKQLFDEIAAEYPSDEFVVDYEQFCASIPQAIIIYNRDAKITYANYAAETLLGYSSQEMIGHRLYHPDWEIFNEKFDPLKTTEHPVLDTTSRGVAKHNVTVYFNKADGTRLRLQISSDPLFHKSTKRLMGAIAVITHIPVEDATSLSVEQQLEEERARVLGEFLRGASHEFKTPLATIHSKLYLMTRKHEELIDAREMIAINHNLDRIVTLFDKLELMLKLEESPRWTQYGLNLKMLMQSIIDNHRYMYSGKIRLEIDQHKHMAVGMVIGNEELVTKAMNELISNAIKFSPNHQDIIVRIYLGDEYVNVDVIDRGIGMNEDVLAKACERFYKADTSEKYQGFGLGLSLVERIMNIHTKYMHITSQPSQGTTVSLGFDNTYTVQRRKERKDT